MDIYDNSDCKIEPEEQNKTFDAMQFYLDRHQLTGVERIQAAYDQGRADESAQAKGNAPCEK